MKLRLDYCVVSQGNRKAIVVEWRTGNLPHELNIPCQTMNTMSHMVVVQQTLGLQVPS